MREKELKDQNKWGAFNKKASHLKSRIIFSSITTIIFTAILIVVSIHLSGIKEDSDKEIKQLNNYVKNLKNKTADIEAKLNDAKKYKQVWKNSSDKKKAFDGIKASDLNNLFTNLSEKHNIISPSIKISVPEVLKGGVFDRQALDVNLSSVSITFEAINDIIAMSFVKDLMSSAPGYFVVTNFSIKKNKSYQDADLVSISSGKMVGSISGNMEVSWYVFKKRITATPAKTENKENK